MSVDSAEKYGFIVVGAGPAGCMVALRLATSKKAPSVLLVEAGGGLPPNSERIDAERWIHRKMPGKNWNYQTTPQKHLDGRIIDYDRGKGLGGTSTISFAVYNIAARDDHDEIARIVGDDEWKWDNAQQRYRRLETYHGTSADVSSAFEKYLKPKAEDHGYEGPIKVAFPKVWEPSVTEQMDICLAAGIKPNPDVNSGDPIGLSILANSVFKGVRFVAADALAEAPSNLHILTDSQVARVKFEGKKAVGITTLDGREYSASVTILSAGALDTPRILMHSGIGPADQLERFNIPVVHANPSIGQNLRDHHHTTPTFLRAGHTSQRHIFYKSKEMQEAARAQWDKDQTGPLAEISCLEGAGFLKSDTVLNSPEFRSLPEPVRAYLEKPTVPSYEFTLNGPSMEFFIDPENAPGALSTIFIIVLNMQSTGTVSLQSSDPSVPLLFDPNFFSHPYDRRVAVEATRDVLKVVRSPGFQKDTLGVVDGPKSDSEEDILDYWRKTTGSTWHMSGTVSMGKAEGESGGCVDKDFKVFGVENLRVADMSVVPIIVK